MLAGPIIRVTMQPQRRGFFIPLDVHRTNGGPSVLMLLSLTSFKHVHATRVASVVRFRRESVGTRRRISQVGSDEPDELVLELASAKP